MNNPFSLGGRGTVEAFYEKLPALLNDSYRLSNFDPILFATVKAFYKNIRNPIFHGNQLKRAAPENVLAVLNMIRLIFNWVDSWYTAFNGPLHEYVRQLKDKE